MSTKIEWTDETWNPVVGCTRVSEGCRNCYAERFVHRFAGEGQRWDGLTKSTPSGPRWTGEARLMPERLDVPLRWKSPRRVFVNSMSDLFHESLSNEAIAAIFGVMAAAQQHTFQVLTKRPARMREWFGWISEVGVSCHPLGAARGVRWYAWCEAGRTSADWERLVSPSWSGRMPDWRWPLPNVWLGVSVENQAAADERIHLLLQTPAALRFLSCEPLIGQVDVRRHLGPPMTYGSFTPGELPIAQTLHGIDWVIAGGESGPGARPMSVEWARSLRAQCEAAAVPFFFKQWGEWAPQTSSVVRTASGAETVLDDAAMVKVGKRTAGAELDGREHKEFPR
jgi:protein gp37